MSSRSDALVTPSVIKWAREKAGLEISSAAGRLGIPESDLIGWETGEKRPSIAQARKACQVYKRSLAVFFLADPPEDFGTIRDFRFFPSDDKREYSPEFALLIRQVYTRQMWMRESLLDEGEEEISFVGAASFKDKPQDVARAIKDTFGVTSHNQTQCHDYRDALRLWIDRVETKGIFVCRQGSIEPEEARGFALKDTYAPFVFVNTSDAIPAQIFTLLHEVVHLWLDQPGISNLEGIDEFIDTQNLEIERFCNKIVAEILVDSNSFRSFWSSITGTLTERIGKASRKYWVSEEVVARKLFDLTEITWEQYLELREKYIERWHAVHKKKDGGDYYRTAVTRNGRRFSRAVLGLYYSDRLTGRDASQLLGVKVSNFSKLASEAGGVAYRGRGDE